MTDNDSQKLLIVIRLAGTGLVPPAVICRMTQPIPIQYAPRRPDLMVRPVN